MYLKILKISMNKFSLYGNNDNILMETAYNLFKEKFLDL